MALCKAHKKNREKEISMKRIVECPSCHTKMQIFDIGRTSKQKCPRCKNDFDITETQDKEKKSSDQKDNSPEKSAEQSANVKSGDSAGQPTTDKSPGIITKKKDVLETDKRNDSEANPVKSEANPVKQGKEEAQKEVASANSDVKSADKTTSHKKMKKHSSDQTTVPPTAEPPIAGLSGLQFMIIFILLVIILVLQIMNMKKNSVLADNQQMIYKKLSLQ
jgi:hypothetical protein